MWDVTLESGASQGTFESEADLAAFVLVSLYNPTQAARSCH